MKKFSGRSGKSVSLSDKALEMLETRPWQGNVRELEHTIERAVALTPNGEEINSAACAEGNSAPLERIAGSGLRYIPA